MTTIIKNNLKLTLRCKGLILIVFCMVLVTGMLSVAFDEFMSDSYEIEGGRIGYSFSEGCKYKMLEPYFAEICKENKLDTVLLTDGSAKTAIESGRADYFAEFTDDGCTVYSDKDHENEAKTLNIIIGSLLSGGDSSQSLSCIKSQTVKIDKIADSTLYYTIAYLVWGIWLSMVVLAVVVSSERKNNIGVRMRTTPVSSLAVYFGKFIPAFVSIALLTAIDVIISTPLFDIKWQEIGTCIVIGLLGCMAAAAVGTVLFTLIKNMIATIVAGYSLVMFWGFVGGSFCPYYYAYFVYDLEKASPVYHMTRALVELNVSGSSNYTSSAIIYLLGITAVCIPLGMLSIKMVKEK